MQDLVAARRQRPAQLDLEGMAGAVVDDDPGCSAHAAASTRATPDATPVSVACSAMNSIERCIRLPIYSFPQRRPPRRHHRS